MSIWYYWLEQRRELEYYKNAVKECQAVIAQLHRGFTPPGQPTYIHPYDVMELMESAPVVTVFSGSEENTVFSGSEENTFEISGQIFKQSIYMPQITRKFS